MPTKEKSNKRVEFPAKLKVKEKSLRKNWKTITRTYKLITPMFGGGFEAAKYDPITPIRASSIKGQLRFWWRATRGGQFDSLEEMKKAEDWLWGTAADDNKEIGESRIKVVVSICDKKSFSANTKYAFKAVGNRVKPDDKVAPGYISFPLRPERGQRPSKKLIMPNNSKADFRLTIYYPTIDLEIKTNCQNTNNKLNAKDELFAALWAWETFGGIGARTRRGFGAISRLPDTEFHLPHSDKMLNWINDNLHHICHGDWPDGIPFIDKDQLEKRLAVIPAKGKLVGDVWTRLVDAFSKFRQMRRGMNRGLWPEADSIRSITKQRLRGGFKKGYVTHEHPKTSVALPSFPRAVLGLPIIFEFPTKRGNKRKYGEPIDKKTIKPDPYTTTLRGFQKTTSRLASPIILRPFVAKDGEPVGLVLALKTNGKIAPLENLSLFDSYESLKQDRLRYSLSSTDVTIIDNACVSEKIYKRLNGASDLSLAVIRFIERYF